MYENQLLMAIDYIVSGRMSYFAHKKCALKHSSQAMEVRVSEMWSQSLKEIQSESLTGTERERDGERNGEKVDLSALLLFVACPGKQCMHNRTSYMY